MYSVVVKCKLTLLLVTVIIGSNKGGFCMPKSKPTSIRLDTKIMDAIRQDAEKEKRSISAQIEYIVEKYYEIKNNLGN